MTSDVMTGRRMKSAVKFTAFHLHVARHVQTVLSCPRLPEHRPALLAALRQARHLRTVHQVRPEFPSHPHPLHLHPRRFDRHVPRDHHDHRHPLSPAAS